MEASNCDFQRIERTVTIGFAFSITNRGNKRYENSSDFRRKNNKGKTDSQLAWLAGKELSYEDLLQLETGQDSNLDFNSLIFSS